MFTPNYIPLALKKTCPDVWATSNSRGPTAGIIIVLPGEYSLLMKPIHSVRIVTNQGKQDLSPKEILTKGNNIIITDTMGTVEC